MPETNDTFCSEAAVAGPYNPAASEAPRSTRPWQQMGLSIQNRWGLFGPQLTNTLVFVCREPSALDRSRARKASSNAVRGITVFRLRRVKDSGIILSVPH